MSDDQDILLAAAGLGFGVFSFFRGFRILRNKRLIENTPTSKCRSVAMGLVELSGSAVGEVTVPSLIGNIPCFCSQVKVERYERSGKSSSWRTVHEELLAKPFFLEDDTGHVKVDPTGAELDIPCNLEYSTESGLGALLGLTLKRMDEAKVSSDAVPGLFRSFCASRNVSFSGPMRFYEHNLCPSDPVYVFGSATEIPGMQDERERVIIQKGKYHPWFFIAEANEQQLLDKFGTSTWLHVFGGAALALICLAWLLFRLSAS